MTLIFASGNMVPLLSKYKICSLQPFSVVAQPGLCGAWSETQIVGFLTGRPDNNEFATANTYNVS